MKYKLVPIEPTEEQWNGLARQVMMWLLMNDRKAPVHLIKHLDRAGYQIPQWLLDEPEMKNELHVMSKGTLCTIIYKAMLDAAPSPPQDPYEALRVAREALQYADDHYCFTNCKQVNEAIRQIDEVIK